MKLQISEIIGDWGVGLAKMVRDNFQKVQQESSQSLWNRGQWTFMELTFSKDQTNYKQVHGLAFQPLDIIQVSKTGTGTIVYNYAMFDSTYLDLTVSGTSATDPLVVRFYLGRFK